VKKAIAVTVAIVFMLAFAAPIFAQDMTWDTTYEMDGDIDIEKQVGHLCNTGAEFKQTIKGEGEMSKVIDTAQVAGKLTVSDSQDWVTAEDAVRNLTVTSVIELCAPAKSVLGEVNLLNYISEDWLDVVETNSGLTGWDAIEWASESLNADWVIPAQSYLAAKEWLDAHEGMVLHPKDIYAMTQDGLFTLDPYNPQVHPIGVNGVTFSFDDNINWSNYVDELTDQIWAVQVEADPGFSGALTQDFEAAYGPWADSHHFPFYWGDPDEPDNAWWFVDDDGEQVGAFGDIDGVEVGKDYVGNYFNIDQMARTSQGTTKRYISISSPWSHAYLMEDMEVVGMAEISESFVMGNLSPGEDTIPDWWDLF